ncbi:type IV secretory system conjugative DNA transfer family protein [Thiocystis violacea]|uniref:type IV secretory system conjugative DNA transfer family protein n=1 Tax=Thiocystis violacea TaxID=13725 RepID=UPI0019057DF3|nr:type IV secretory system conjugative DNA transfer family protein [Thiocystis violacea]MBK1718077.1 conjugal transfer protein TraG [Thiocystis violacea]
MNTTPTPGTKPRIGAPRRYAGRLVFFALSLLAGMQVATQMCAARLSYQAILGASFNFGPLIDHVYVPWAIVQWAYWWHEAYPDLFLQSGSVGVAVAAVGVLLLALATILQTHSSIPYSSLHGSARWADDNDLRRAGILPSPGFLAPILGRPAPAGGVYVGGWVDRRGRLHYLRHNGPEHVLTYAPTRSGKGVSLVLPTLLSWTESALITDLKGELYALTAGWRKRYAGQKVLRFEPASMNGTVHWNPLDEVRIGSENEVGDAQNLASLIVDPDGRGLESHWQKTAWALICGLILHVLYRRVREGTLATLPAVDALVSDPDRGVAEVWMEMATYSHLDSGESHPLVAAAARDMMDRPEEEAGSVLSTAKSYLALYRDPVVARSVSRSDFRVRDLMQRDDPVSLYIVTTPTDKTRLRPLVRVLLSMALRVLAGRLEFDQGQAVASYKHRLLCLFDEFPSLGKLEILQESLAFLAGYGIKCYLICQDLNQLRSRETGYGPDETITSNCHVQNAFQPNRIETADHLSRLTGPTTVVKEQITTSGKRLSAVLTQVSRTYQEVQRNLMNADEIMRMKGPLKDGAGRITEAGDMLIYVAGYPAIYGRQPLYFQDRVFTARAVVPAPDRSDTFSPPETEVRL